MSGNQRRACLGPYHQMGISSTQRRHERYLCLYLWKMLEEMVANNGAVEAQWGNRGRLVKIPKSQGSQATRTLRDSSFTVRAGRIFNVLPRNIRDYRREGTTLAGFKMLLDCFLELVPDQPRDIRGGWLPAAMDQVTGMNPNSLLHWAIHLRKTNPEYQWR